MSPQASSQIRTGNGNGAVVQAARAATGRKPKTVVANAGYRAEDNFAKLEKRQIAARVALGCEGQAESPASPPPGPATARTASRMASPDGGVCRAES